MQVCTNYNHENPYVSILPDSQSPEIIQVFIETGTYKRCRNLALQSSDLTQPTPCVESFSKALKEAKGLDSGAAWEESEKRH